MAGEFEQRDQGVESMGMGTPTSGDGAREKVRAASRDLLDQAIERKDELKQRASSMVDERTQGFAQRGDAITQALHGAASSLRDSGETQLSSWVEQAAGQVERVVGYLRGSQPDGMMSDLEDLARKNPAMFLGGTYVAGLALGRFLRASSPERRESDTMSDMHEQNRNAGGFEDASLSAGYESGAAGTASSGISEGWSGVGIAPGTFESPVSDTGVARQGTSSLGASDTGLTDEDMREAWHGDQPRSSETDRPGYGANSAHEGTDTGQLTRYTHDENEDDNRRGV